MVAEQARSSSVSMVRNFARFILFGSKVPHLRALSGFNGDMGSRLNQDMKVADHFGSM